MTKQITSSSALCSLLERHFGFTEFLDCQEEAVRAIIEGKDVFVNVATSGGKSLTFQLPALVLDGLTIVVSPLIALMHDQVDNLEKRGITAAFIDSTLDVAGLKEQWARVTSGDAKLLYCSPEQLMTNGFFEKLGKTRVSRLVVDEAHCVSVWGHDFRREYLDIPEARRRLGNPPIVALTATAPVLVRDDILASLQIEDCLQIVGEMDRRNLIIDVENFYSSDSKWEWLLKKLRSHSKAEKKTIVYCRRIKTVEALAEALSDKRGISFDVYHGQMEKDERRAVEVKFRDGITPILIGTKAFGMGIDIEDVRYVYHYEVPESLESYWQEIGRAGRDGHRSHCTLMYEPRDVNQIQHFVRASNPTLSFIEKVWDALTRWVKDWNVDVPERYYNEDKFARDFGGGDDFMVGMVRAAIAQLAEHHMIEIWGTTCRFLIKPEQIRDSGFPIEELTIDNKRDAAVQRLKIVIYYANHAGDNPRRIIMDHFLYNAVADLVKDLDLTTWYQVPEEILLPICSCVGVCDMQSKNLAAFLRGTSRVAAKNRNDSYGALKKFSPFEVRMDTKQAAVMGYLRPFKLDDRTFITLTPQGLEFLKRNGIELKPATKYDELKQSMHSPVNRDVLDDALRSWRIIYSGRRSPNEWWRAIDEFMESRYDVLDQTLDGFQLVADFSHKKAIFKKARGRSATTGKAKAGIRKTDAKLMLNYVFGNIIET